MSTGLQFVLTGLLAVDFTSLDVDPGVPNVTTRGGTREVESPEKAIQEQRELKTLYAIYTSPLDIPKSPREPLDPYTGPHSDEIPFGTPPEKVTVRHIFRYSL